MFEPDVPVGWVPVMVIGVRVPEQTGILQQVSSGSVVR